MADTIRFGIYELDRSALELRRYGARMRVQEQPLRVLAALVAQPGQLVTREELQKQIRGDAPFGDRDHSLNKAINYLREVLDDTPRSPRYIETVPRRGYRFIAPVAEAVLTEAPPQIEPGVTAAAKPGESPRDKIRFHPMLVLVLAALLASAGVVAVVVSRHPAAPGLQEPKLIGSFAWSPAISRDGNLVAYASGDEIAPPQIFVQQAAGGQPVPITSGSDAEADPDFSPDGTHIVYVSSKGKPGLYVVPALGGEARLLLPSTTAGHPKYSPSGDRVLFIQDAKVFTISGDGAEPSSLPLNEDFEIFAAPLWAPNGTDLLVYGTRHSQPGLVPHWWITPTEGGQSRMLQVPGFDQTEQNVMVTNWIRTTGNEEVILFSTREATAKRPNGWALWQAEISTKGVIERPPRLIQRGVGNVGNAATAAGKFIYRTQMFAGGIHQIALDHQGGEGEPVTQLSLPLAGWHTGPSLSRDGRWMAYNSRVPGNPDRAMLRDLDTGAEHMLDHKGILPNGRDPVSISPDGSKVIVGHACSRDFWAGDPTSPLPCGFLTGQQGGELKQVCTRCTPRGFSSDGSIVLLEKFGVNTEEKTHIAALDLGTGQEKDLLRIAGMDVNYAFFSWDRKWLVFRKAAGPNAPASQIMIAPMRGGSVANEAEWIEVTDGKQLDDKPQWSADGRILYFTSTRDRYLCIFGQRLNPRTKRPIGKPFALEHFHNEEGRTANFMPAACDLTVARSRALINLPRVQTQVWMIQKQ